MAIINKLENTASISYDGAIINSNVVDTLLLVVPTIVKAVDKLTAKIGEILTYTVTIANLGLTELSKLPFTDEIPAGSVFEKGTFKINGAVVEPMISGNTLTYTIPDIEALGIATIEFQTLIVG